MSQDTNPIPGSNPQKDLNKQPETGKPGQPSTDSKSTQLGSKHEQQTERKAV